MVFIPSVSRGWISKGCPGAAPAFGATEMGLEPLGAPWIRGWMLQWGLTDRVGFGLILEFQPQVEFWGSRVASRAYSCWEIWEQPRSRSGGGWEIPGIRWDRPGSTGVPGGEGSILGAEFPVFRPSGPRLEYSGVSLLPMRIRSLLVDPGSGSGSRSDSNPCAIPGLPRERPDFSGISLLRGFGMLRLP